MKYKIKKHIKEILLFIITITIFVNAISLYRSMDLNKEPLDTQFIINKDKPTLVYIWGSWCPICKLQSPSIQTISENFNVITIAVKSGSNDEVTDYLLSNGFSFKFINDEDGYLAEKFGVNIYPTTIIYNKDRNVIFSDVGYTSTWGLYLRMLWAGK